MSYSYDHCDDSYSSDEDYNEYPNAEYLEQLAIMGYYGNGPIHEFGTVFNRDDAPTRTHDPKECHEETPVIRSYDYEHLLSLPIFSFSCPDRERDTFHDSLYLVKAYDDAPYEIFFKGVDFKPENAIQVCRVANKDSFMFKHSNETLERRAAELIDAANDRILDYETEEGENERIEAILVEEDCYESVFCFLLTLFSGWCYIQNIKVCVMYLYNMLGRKRLEYLCEHTNLSCFIRDGIYWMRGFKLRQGVLIPDDSYKCRRRKMKDCILRKGDGRFYLSVSAWIILSLVVPGARAQCELRPSDSCFPICDSNTTFFSFTSSPTDDCSFVNYYNSIQSFQLSHYKENETIVLCFDKRTAAPSDFCQTFCFLNNNTCDGDHSYCGEHLPHCNKNSICDCKSVLITDDFVQMLNLTNHSWIPPIWINPSVTIQKRMNVDPFCRLIGDNVSANWISHFTGKVLIRKDDWIREIFLSDAISFSEQLPRKVFLLGGFVYIDFSQDSWSDGCKVEVSQKFICEFSDCLLCVDSIHSFTCMPNAHKSLVILTIISSVTALLAMSPWILMGILMLINLIFLPLKATYWGIRYCWNSERFSSFRGSIYDNVKVDSSDGSYREKERDVASQEVPKEETYTSNGRRYYAPKGRNNVVKYLLILSLICCAQSACVNSISIPSSQIICLGQNCSVTFSTLVSLPFPTAEFCISMLDSNGSPLGSINVKLEEVLQKVNLKALYYTSGWTGTSQFVKRCYNAGPCSGDACTLTPSAGGIDAYEQLDDSSVILFPGVTNCMPTGGCAGNGCFYCNDACLFYRWALMPSGSIYKVLEPDSSFLQPKISLTFNNKTLGSTSIIGIDTVFNDWKLRIEGSLQGDTTIFAANKIISAGNSSWYGSASESNSPQAATVGDIQATTQASFSSPSTSMFIFDSSIATVSGAGSVIFNSQGINDLTTYKKFPILIGSSSWSLDSNFVMQQNVSNPGAVIFTLSTNKPFNFTRSVDLVCPKVQAFNASGCFSCTTGSEVMLELKSDCQSGIVVLTSSSTTTHITTVSASIGLTYQWYHIRFTTSVKETSFDLIIIGSGGNSSVHVSFTAVEDVNLSGDNSTSSTPGIGDSPVGISLLNPQSWKDWLIWSVVIFVLICLLVGAGVLLYYSITLGWWNNCKACCSQCKGSKMAKVAISKSL